ncbi:MAG: rod shape-determining protein RodA [Veillonellaceae bacterium]|nr:rod shape-determining protein RodA [Veillonellaceae bacterium]
MSGGRWWQQTDRVLLAVTLLLVLLGLMLIASATFHVGRDGAAEYGYVLRQGGFFLPLVLGLGFLQRYDYRRLFRRAYWLYGLNLLMLAAVMAVGVSALGAQRWIQIGPVSLQPSEFAKLLYIISLARFLCSARVNLQRWRGLVWTVLFLLPPFMLVLLQPDLGTSLVFCAITLGMIYIAGVRPAILQRMFLGGLALLPVMWFFVMKDYQRNRILVLLDPESDPFNAGYHVIQSKIAIGSGGLIGKGLFEGTQSQLNFLPENHTDFIFAVLGEEWGLVGALVLLLLYFVLLYRGVSIAASAQDEFGRYAAAGIVAMWLFQILVNIGMTVGLMPVTGIPLPFLSYGVSSLTANLCAVALLLNIYMRRKTALF